MRFAMCGRGDPEGQFDLFDNVIGQVDQRIDLSCHLVNVAILKTITFDQQRVFHPAGNQPAFQCGLTHFGVGNQNVLDVDEVNAVNSVFFEPGEYGRRAKAHEIELAHQHGVNVAIASQDHIAESLGQFGSHRFIITKYRQLAFAGVPGVAHTDGRRVIHVGVFAIDDLRVMNVLAVEFGRQRIQQHRRIRGITFPVGKRFDKDVLCLDLREQFRQALFQIFLCVTVQSGLRAFGA